MTLDNLTQRAIKAHTGTPAAQPAQAPKGEAPMQVRAHQGFYENPQPYQKQRTFT